MVTGQQRVYPKGDGKGVLGRGMLGGQIPLSFSLWALVTGVVQVRTLITPDAALSRVRAALCVNVSAARSCVRSISLATGAAEHLSRASWPSVYLLWRRRP